MTATKENRQRTAAEAYLQVAAAHGIDHIFGLPGTSGQEFLGTIAEQESIRYVLALHETCVVSMADGYARMSGKPTLAQVSTLPGTANSVGALYDAFRDRSPVVVTSTQVDTRISGRDSHTEARDMIGLTGQFTKWSHEVHRSDRIVEALERAFKVASAPPRGPVYLSLPSNLLADDVGPGPRSGASRIVPRMAADREAIQEAAQILEKAERPLIVAGSGVGMAGATDDLIRLAELVVAPVVMEPRYSYLSFPTTHPFSFQIPERDVSFELPIWGSPDLILAIGCRLIREYRYLPEPPIKSGTRCIHIEEDPWELGKVFPVDLGIIADPKSALQALEEAYSVFDGSGRTRGREERRKRLGQAREQARAALEKRIVAGWDAAPINPARLVREMDRLLGPDVMIVNESPTMKDTLLSNFNFTKERSYFSNSSGGYLGWGLGAAIGAQLAAPQRRVVACLGDGSAMFGLQGLWTLAKYRIPLLVLVFNNRAYMAVKNQFRGSEERIRRAAQLGADLEGPDLDFARLAESFGIFGQRVTEPGAIEPALTKALAQRGPAVVDIHISQASRKD